MKAFFTKDQVTDCEFLPRKEGEKEQRLIYTGMPKELGFEDEPWYNHEGKHEKFGAYTKILNPYRNPESIMVEIMGRYTRLYGSTKAEAKRLGIMDRVRHEMSRFDLLEAMCALEDGYCDALQTGGIFSNAYSPCPIKFTNSAMGKKARAEMGTIDSDKLKNNPLNLDRNNTFYLMSLGAGFGSVYYADVNPDNEVYKSMVAKDPEWGNDPHFYRDVFPWNAKHFTSLDEINDVYAKIETYDAKNNLGPGERYAQGYDAELWSQGLLDWLKKNEEIQQAEFKKQYDEMMSKEESVSR